LRIENGEFKEQTGTLYIVPTPIGNMGDISGRVKDTLESVDFVACEDTRVGGRLLFLLGIKKELVSHHDHNKKQSALRIRDRLLKGESCALISDAGTPAVSDPGELLVDLCIASDVKIIPLPGPCAAVCALSASGLPSGRFVFEGFLPEKAKERKKRLAVLSRETRSAILYCAPHDLITLLSDFISTFKESKRRVFIARELTKLNEQLVRTTLGKALETAENGGITMKGEFVIVLEGTTEEPLKENTFWDDMDIPTHVAHYTALGLSQMDAIKKAAKDRGVAKAVVYDEVVGHRYKEENN